MPEWLNIQDPLVRTIVAASACLILLVIVLWIVGRRRTRQAEAERRQELRRGYESLRLRQEEIKRLAARIESTSSTGQIAGFVIIRQVETVFSEAKASSVTAVELVKALAGRKGANAIINLKTQQMPTGKWVASGDAVVVQVAGSTEHEQPEKQPPTEPPADSNNATE